MSAEVYRPVRGRVGAEEGPGGAVGFEHLLETRGVWQAPTLFRRSGPCAGIPGLPGGRGGRFVQVRRRSTRTSELPAPLRLQSTTPPALGQPSRRKPAGPRPSGLDPTGGQRAAPVAPRSSARLRAPPSPSPSSRPPCPPAPWPRGGVISRPFVRPRALVPGPTPSPTCRSQRRVDAPVTEDDRDQVSKGGDVAGVGQGGLSAYGGAPTKFVGSAKRPLCEYVVSARPRAPGGSDGPGPSSAPQDPRYLASGRSLRY